jgi:hypothetical protein
MGQEIDIDRKKQFEVLKSVCVNGRVIFYMVGQALGTIRDEKLYEVDGFTDFQAFCDSIGYSKRHCDRFIIGAKVISELPEKLRTLVSSESAARALLNVPASLRVMVAMKASANARRPITAKKVKLLSAPPRPKKRDTIGLGGDKPRAPIAPPRPKTLPKTVDKTGLEIPKEALEFWKRRGEVASLLTDVSTLRSALRKAREESDTLFAEVDFTDDESILNRLYEDIKTAMPHAVCPECNGKINVAKCSVCSGRGFVSEFYWTTKIPQEIKDITGRE